MNKEKFKTSIFIFFLIIFVFHLAGYLKGLYYSLSFYDNILHFAAGAAISLSILYILFSSKTKEIFKIESEFANFILAFTTTVTLGVFWEFLEFLWDLYIVQTFNLPSLQLGLRDTMSDLMWDSIGSVLVIIGYFLLKIRV